MSWIPLHVHSQYSILESTASISGLVKKASEYKLQALSLTDQGNLFGAVDFYKACTYAKIKPIIGAELFVAPFSRHDKKRIHGYSAGYPIVLLVKNKKGYSNLCKLTSLAHMEGFYYKPRIDLEILKQYREGLICTTACAGGVVSTHLVNGNYEKAREVAG